MNRAPSIIWCARRPGTYPQSIVRTTDDDMIEVAHWYGENEIGTGIWLSRKDARLLAKRINECLDRTVKR